jgi:type IV pilus assembly protein PilA
MLAFMTKAMNRKDRERGWSLPEILVALVIIVIVGAWAMTNLMGQRAKGVDGGVRSDLSAMAIAQETWITDNPYLKGIEYKNGTFTLPAAGTYQGSAPDFKKTSGNVIVVGVTPNTAPTKQRGYCIAGWNPDGSRQGAAAGADGAGKFWYDSALGGMQPGPDMPTGGACAVVTAMPTA